MAKCIECERHLFFKGQLCPDCREKAGMPRYEIVSVELDIVGKTEGADFHDGAFGISWVALPLGFGNVEVFVDAETKEVVVRDENMDDEFIINVFKKLIESARRE